MTAPNSAARFSRRNSAHSVGIYIPEPFSLCPLRPWATLRL